MLQIRRYQAQDNEAVKELHYAGLAQFGATADPYYDSDLDNIEDIYINNHGDFLVGTQGDEIVAMGAIRKVSARRGEIKRIRVRRDCQRQGYGQAILLKLMEIAAELGYIELCLDTVAKNMPAQRLFEKHDFIETHHGKVGPYELIFYDKRLNKDKGGVIEMDASFKNKFLALWKKYFNNAELPFTFYYTDEEGHAEPVKPGSVPRCIIGALVKVRSGHSLAFNVDSVGCPGGKRYLGFTESLMPDFEYFLSCGIPGKMEGERYKKSPEMVKEYMKKHAPVMKAPGRYIVFKRWDKLDETDRPEVVIFFAEPDALSGLFTLASFDEAEQNMVIAPFGSGCASIVQYPYMETKSKSPRAVIGMFDVSARPSVPQSTLTFSAPLAKFARMVDNMEESFLITPSWAKVQKRIKSIKIT